MKHACATIVLAMVVSFSIPAAAHHSNPLYFDVSSAITLEGEVLRVEWINPHVLLFLQAKNEEGDLETWIIQGTSNVRQVRATMGERLMPGTPISARVWPPRNPLFLNNVQTVLLTRPDDPRKYPRIVAGGQIRFSNGDVLAIGGGPTF